MFNDLLPIRQHNFNFSVATKMYPVGRIWIRPDPKL